MLASWQAATSSHRRLLHRVLVPPRLPSRGGASSSDPRWNAPVAVDGVVVDDRGGGHGTVARRRARIRRARRCVRPAPPPTSSFPGGSCAMIGICRADAADGPPAPPPSVGGGARIPSRRRRRGTGALSTTMTTRGGKTKTTRRRRGRRNGIGARTRSVDVVVRPTRRGDGVPGPAPENDVSATTTTTRHGADPPVHPAGHVRPSSATDSRRRLPRPERPGGDGDTERGGSVAATRSATARFRLQRQRPPRGGVIVGGAEFLSSCWPTRRRLARVCCHPFIHMLASVSAV